MYEPARTESDPHVRRTATDGLEEHEVSGLNLILPDLVALVVLFPHLSREDCAVLGKHPLHEAAAIEPPRRLGATVQVGCASKRKCRGNQFGDHGWSICGRRVARDGPGNVRARKGLGSRHTATACTSGDDAGYKEQCDESAPPIGHHVTPNPDNRTLLKSVYRRNSLVT